MFAGIAKAIFGSSNDRYVKSMQPTITRLPSSACRAEQSRCDCAVSIETWRQLHCASSGRKE